MYDKVCYYTKNNIIESWINKQIHNFFHKNLLCLIYGETIRPVTSEISKGKVVGNSIFYRHFTMDLKTKQL